MTESFVIDSAERCGPQQTIQLLADADLFAGDDARGALLLAKRINHALYADFSRESIAPELRGQIEALQTQYRPLVQNTPYAELLESGALQKLLDGYMSILVTRSSGKRDRLESGALEGDERHPALLMEMIAEERAKLKKLIAEQATYRSGGDYLKSQLAGIEPLVKQTRYLSLGRLAEKSGMVKNATAEQAADLVNDVLATAAARTIRRLAEPLACIDGVAQNPDSPEARTRADMMALAVREATKPLSALFEFESVHPDCDRIGAMLALLSAQLHQAFSEELTQAQRVALEKDARTLVKDYAQVAMSLAFHVMNDGAAADDPRTRKMKANFAREMETRGIALIAGKDEAIDRARKLARASAEDLMQAAGEDERLATAIKTLAKAAGDPVDQLPLQAKSQLIGIKISDPADYHHIVPQSYVAAMREAQERVLSGGLAAALAVALFVAVSSPAHAASYEADRRQALTRFKEPEREACGKALTARYNDRYTLSAPLSFNEPVSKTVYDSIYWKDRGEAPRGVVFSAAVDEGDKRQAGTLLCYYGMSKGGLELQNAFVMPLVSQRLASLSQ